jgi:hypothetical protein
MREVIRSLSAWDGDLRRQVLLPPGTILTGCQIRRQIHGKDGIEVYSVEYEWGGRRFASPLFLFQPRTCPVDSAAPRIELRDAASL